MKKNKYKAVVLFIIIYYLFKYFFIPILKMREAELINWQIQL